MHRNARFHHKPVCFCPAVGCYSVTPSPMKNGNTCCVKAPAEILHQCRIISRNQSFWQGLSPADLHNSPRWRIECSSAIEEAHPGRLQVYEQIVYQKSRRYTTTDPFGKALQSFSKTTVSFQKTHATVCGWSSPLRLHRKAGGDRIRKSASIKLVVHPPQTPAGRQALARRAAETHAAAAAEHIKALPCPLPQQLALLDAVIQKVKAQAPDSEL